jgi:hypothetical protein
MFVIYFFREEAVGFSSISKGTIEINKNFKNI